MVMQVKHLMVHPKSKRHIQEAHMDGYKAERELLKAELLVDGKPPTAFNLFSNDPDLQDFLAGTAFSYIVCGHVIALVM